MAQARICSTDHREEASESHWLDPGRSTWIWIAVVAGLFVVLFRHEIGRLASRWASDASWSHGFLIPLLSLYFVRQRLGLIRQARVRPSLLGCVLLVFWIAVYVFNVVSPSGYAYLRSFAMVMALGSMVLFLGGWGVLRHTWLAVAYLLFAVPVPDRAYVAMTMPLRMAAARVAAAFLDLVPHVEAVARGAVIDVVYKGQVLEPALDVAEACSGMRLLMAFVALGVALAFIHQRPRWQRGVLLACTVPIAVLCNLLRVTLTGFIYVLIGPAYAQGTYHDLLGFAMLPLALGLYGLLGWFMSSLFVEDSDGQPPDVVVRRRQDKAGSRLQPVVGSAVAACDRPAAQDLAEDRARPVAIPGGRAVRSATLACAVLLALAGAALSAVSEDLGLAGKPLALRRPLDQMDEASLSPFRIVSRLQIDDPAVLQRLGTADYVQWALQDTRPDGAGVRSVLVFITYYGLADRVPHVPEECYVGAGFQCLAEDQVTLSLEGPGPQHALAARYLLFGPTRAAALTEDTATVPVLYLFRVNGQYASTRNEVRRALNRGFLAGRSYFSKVELVFAGDSGVVPDKAQALRAGQRLLAVLLPVLERDHWPQDAQ